MEYEKITYKELMFRLSGQEVIKYVPITNEVVSFFVAYLLKLILKLINRCKRCKQDEFVTPERLLPIFNNARNFTFEWFGEKSSEKAEKIIKFGLLENLIGPTFASKFRALTQ